MLINTLITVILPFLGGLYLVARVYSSIFKISPKHELSLKELTQSIQKMSGVWWFLIPFIGAGVLIYNLSVNALWVIGELIGWGVKAIQWIYQEVIVAGLFLIAKTVWHYIILWPWRIFSEGFSWIKPSLSLQNFKIGFISLFAALSFVFLGRYLEMGLHWPNWITMLFELLSVIPLGVGAGQLILANGKNKSAVDSKEIRNKYVKHLGYLLGLFGLLIFGELLIIWLFSFSGFASTLSALWIGGNIITSILLILNGLLLVFTISVLPSFSMDNDSDLKSFISSYWEYLKVKGLHHFLAMGGSVIPAIILCLLPYYLMSGSMYVAGQLTEEVKTLRLENDKDSAYDFSISKLKSLTATNDGQLTVELEKHANYVNSANSNSDVIRNFDYLNSFYSRRGAEYAAAPIGLAIAEYTYYMTHAKNYLNSERMPSAEPLDTNAFKDEISVLETDNDELKQAIEPAQVNEPVAIDTSVSKVPAVAQADDVASVPAADSAISMIPPANNDAVNQNKLQIERNNKIIAHLSELRENSISSGGIVSLSDKLAFLIYSLWLAAAIAASLALGFVLFVLYQRNIYGDKVADSSWYITGLITEAHSKNKNQPLMALVLLFVFYYAYSHNNYNPLTWKLPVFNKSIESAVTPSNMDNKMYIDTMPSQITDPENEDYNNSSYVNSVLTVERVESTSEYTSNNKTYSAQNMIDGNYETWWTPFPTDGSSSSATFVLNNKYKVGGLKIINGSYGKYYYDNSRVTQILVTFEDGESEMKDLTDLQDYQEIEFDKKHLTSFLNIAILNREIGNKWDDICISEIEILGSPIE